MYSQPSQKYGKLIRVDPEVRAAIEEFRGAEESINAALRRVLGLPPKKEQLLKIGRLFVPLGEPETPNPYKLSPEAKAARIALCKAGHETRKVSNFQRIWDILNKE